MQTILLVEDSKLLRISTERAMMKAGYCVISACDGDEALQVAANSLPDLIVLDMLLPKRSGPDVLRALKEDLRTADIPVVVSSGIYEKNADKLIQQGACAFVEKNALLDDADPLLQMRIPCCKRSRPHCKGHAPSESWHSADERRSWITRWLDPRG